MGRLVRQAAVAEQNVLRRLFRLVFYVHRTHNPDMTVTLRYSPPARRPVRSAVDTFAAFRATYNDGDSAWEHPAAST